MSRRTRGPVSRIPGDSISTPSRILGSITPATNVNIQTFNGDGMWAKPPGAKSVHVIIIAGGGSGAKDGGSADNASGAGGGGGHEFTIDASLLGSTEVVTVGAGGAEVTTNVDGNDGGDSSFGSWGTAKGGKKGINAPGAAVGGAGGDGSDNVIAGTTTGSNPYEGGIGVSDAVGGKSIFGGGAGGGVSDASDNAGGPSDLGGGGGAGDGAATAGSALGGVSKRSGNGGKISSTESERDGVAPGGGGAGVNTDFNSGAGAAGRITVTTYF